MDKNNSRDKLNRFLIKSFDRFHDSPDNTVWDRISADLDDEFDSKPWYLFKVGWYRIVAGLLVLFLFVELVLHNQQLNLLTDKIEINTEDLQKLESRIILEPVNTKKKESPIAINHQQDNLSIIDQKSKATNDDRALTLVRNPYTKTSFSKEYTNSHVVINQEHQQFKSKAYLENTTKSSNVNTNFKVDGRRGIITVSPIKSINSLCLSDHSDEVLEIDFESLLILSKTLTEPLRHKRITIGGHYAILNTTRNMKINGNPSTVNLNDFFPPQINGITNTYGIVARYHTNKNWFFDLGIMHRRTTLNSSSQHKFKFGEFLPESNLNQYYNSSQDVFTEAGALEMELRIEQTSVMQIEEGESINLKMNMIHHKNYVSIPMFLGYDLAQRNRFSMSLKAGVFAKFLYNNTLEVESYKLSNNNFRMTSAPSFPNRPEGKSLEIDYSATIDFRYGITPNIAFSVAPTVFGNVNSPNNFPVSVNKRSVGLDFGIVYSL